MSLPVHWMRASLIWMGLLGVLALPVIVAAFSPLLQWRDPIYIAAGFAGIIGLSLMALQPLLAVGALPWMSPHGARRLHRLVGVSLLLCVVLHILGLWITSPPDVIDVLLFRSPTPFSLWGVAAMWGLFASAALVLFRRKLRLKLWRMGHAALALVIVGGTIAHAMLIDGTMETSSKLLICMMVAISTLKVLSDLWLKKRQPRAKR